ncbi:hypothetical protein LPJ72_000212 [Coemansia sp. Benny D160-2]|nr:hypothetical protein LPJ72_000212 [Coemansia sp. Benny D160-2]
MSAPQINSIEIFKARLEEQDKLLLFFFFGYEEKSPEGIATLKNYLKLAKKYNIAAGQWNNYVPPKDEDADEDEEEIKDYFDEEYGVTGTLGVIMFRDHKYLTCIRNITDDEETKLETFEKVLTEYDTWPVRKSPKEIKESAPPPKKASSGCCIIL